MKFIYVTDIHYGATPVCRKDNYNQSILNKLKQVFDYANAKDIDIIVIGGDLFDRPHQAYCDIIPLFKMFTDQINLNNTRFIINRGNPTHDGVMENSPLTLLESMNPNNIILSDCDKSFDIECPTEYVRIIFAPNSVDLNTYDITPYIENNSIYTNILLTHHILVHEQVPYKHILWQDFADKYKGTNLDTVFIADYHPFQESEIINDIQFVSTGSLCRRKYTKDNINKIPKFCVYDTVSYKIDYINLDVDNDIWNIPEDENVAESELDMEQFKNNISDFQEDMNLESMWSKFISMNQHNFDKRVVDIIYDRIKKGFTK